jgi:RNA polymerase sigma factor (sigma-70 family)
VADPSDEALMRRYVAGEQAAFGELFARYAPRLTRLMRRDLGDQDADDLVQQAFLQFHRARFDFKEGAAVRPWLYTIALNLKRQQFRRLGRKRDTVLEEETLAHAGGDPEAALRDAQLRAALDALPEPQREAIVLHWFEGLTFPEIAQIVGTKLGAVRVRAHRGYRRLREILEAAEVTEGPSPAYAPGRTP